MDLENIEFIKFVEAANKNGLDYILIDGMALYMNGIERLTKDADIWIRPNEDSKFLFSKTLIDIEYEKETVESLIEDLDFTQPQVITIAGPIDILTVVHKNIDFQECFNRSRKCLIADKYEIKVLHLNDIRELKILARRPQDLRDIILIDDFMNENNITGFVRKESDLFERFKFRRKNE